MELKFKRDLLLKPLTSAVGFVEKKQTMPVLSNIYIKKAADTLTLIANDLEIQVTIKSQGEMQGEDFILTLPAKKLLDILKTLPDNEEISLDYNNGKVLLKSGRTKFTLQSLSADHYPLLNLTDASIAKFTLKQSDFRNLIAKVQYAMAVNDSRVFLNGMLLEVKNQQLNLVATDAHRLSMVTSPLTEVSSTISVILPRKTTLELLRLLDGGEEFVKVTVYPNQVAFETQTKQLISKVIEGKYPDYERVIPLTNDKLCLIAREDFLHAVQRIAVIGIDKLKTLTVELKPNLLILSCRNEEQEESRDELNIQYSGSELVMNFNISYILDILSNSKENFLQWAFYDSQRSVLISVPENTDFKHVIMPLRS